MRGFQHKRLIENQLKKYKKQEDFYRFFENRIKDFGEKMKNDVKTVQNLEKTYKI